MATVDLLTNVRRYDRATGDRLPDVSADEALSKLAANYPTDSRESLARLLASGRELVTPGMLYTIRDLD